MQISFIHRKPRRGVVLLLVVVVIAMLSLAALSFAQLMIQEHKAAVNANRQAQARAFAQSGAEVARQFLSRDPADQTSAGGVYDNSSRFADQVIDTNEGGKFTIVAPKSDGITISGVRYGLQDESTRINLATILNYDHVSSTSGSSSSSTTTDDGTNTSNEPAANNTNAHAILMGLPGMTDDIADAILDWLDPDDTPRPNGAESQYYLTLPHPYTPRNGTPTSLDELLLVRGVTPELLYGADAAKMGLSGSNASTSGIAGVNNANGVMDHGWAAYLTLWSAEGNLNEDGSQKINLNDSDLETLYNNLSETIDQPTAEFIVAYRMGGKGQSDGSGHLDLSQLSQSSSSSNGSTGGSNNGSGGSGSNGTGGASGGAAGGTQIKSILDLVGATATLTQPSTGTNGGQNGGPGGGQTGGRQPPPVQVKNPMGSDSGTMSNYLPKLYANCTTSANPATAGRININQASRTVLLCIPNMTSDLADAIISQRQQDPNTQTDADRCPAWPLIRGIVPLATMKTIMPYITGGGSVYRAQVIGSFDKGGSSARVEVVIDATQNPARMVFWKDISSSQGGFPVEPTPPDKQSSSAPAGSGGPGAGGQETGH